MSPVQRPGTIITDTVEFFQQSPEQMLRQIAPGITDQFHANKIRESVMSTLTGSEKDFRAFLSTYRSNPKDMKIIAETIENLVKDNTYYFNNQNRRRIPGLENAKEWLPIVHGYLGSNR